MAIVKASVILTGWLLAASAVANTPDAAGTHGLIKPLPQTQTERWLQVQREGSRASAQTQASTAAEQELASQRWLDSYQHPIPDLYEQGVEGQVGGN
ncbi:DUF3613 domain-containing protein [Oceanimonas smirnovii]|uniref:DUF3613 domain-containing protein n=1 Tax=Oceanimonas smirnovii TaxID=264574 RepID=UPI00035CC044|nr:DUF3613 domain-containing protein [Oceanimonas smirnovii]